VIAVLNAVLAFFYYLSIVWAIYVDESTEAPISLSTRHRAVMVVCTTAILAIGVFPQPLLGAASQVSKVLFGS
jgi:NADH:ubiquinone oxidoreductase subunit 2 (subunit N)